MHQNHQKKLIIKLQDATLTHQLKTYTFHNSLEDLSFPLNSKKKETQIK